MIRRIQHVQITIPPGTETEARNFYCGILGLLEIEKLPHLKSEADCGLCLATSKFTLEQKNT